MVSIQQSKKMHKKPRTCKRMKVKMDY